MVKEKIALDTNIVIDIFNNKKNIITILNNYQTIYLPITVCGELLFGAKNLNEKITLVSQASSYKR